MDPIEPSNHLKRFKLQRFERHSWRWLGITWHIIQIPICQGTLWSCHCWRLFHLLTCLCSPSNCLVFTIGAIWHESWLPCRQTKEQQHLGENINITLAELLSFKQVTTCEKKTHIFKPTPHVHLPCPWIYLWSYYITFITNQNNLQTYNMTVC